MNLIKNVPYIHEKVSFNTHRTDALGFELTALCVGCRYQIHIASTLTELKVVESVHVFYRNFTLWEIWKTFHFENYPSTQISFSQKKKKNISSASTKTSGNDYNKIILRWKCITAKIWSCLCHFSWKTYQFVQVCKTLKIIWKVFNWLFYTILW